METKNIDFRVLVGFITVFIFPFAARGILDVTKIPLIAAIIYYGVFGILIRLKLEGRLPYLRPQISKVKWETLFFFIGALLCAYLYVEGVEPIEEISGNIIANLFVFALINGTFEHLVWVNIYDLIGSKNKVLGVIATTIYVSLIHILYWSKFIPSPSGDGAAIIFILSQLSVLWIPLWMYHKTKDLTLWSIQHVAYNVLSVLIGGFGLDLFIHY